MITSLQASSSFLYYLFLIGYNWNEKIVDSWIALSTVVSAPLLSEATPSYITEPGVETDNPPDLISIVTHELHTPLTSIRAASEILYDNPALTLSQRQQFLGIILQESEKLTQAVSRTLALLESETAGN